MTVFQKKPAPFFLFLSRYFFKTCLRNPTALTVSTLSGAQASQLLTTANTGATESLRQFSAFRQRCFAGYISLALVLTTFGASCLVWGRMLLSYSASERFSDFAWGPFSILSSNPWERYLVASKFPRKPCKSRQETRSQEWKGCQRMGHFLQPLILVYHALVCYYMWFWFLSVLKS